MITSLLAQVDPKAQVKALEMGQENPLWVIVAVLVGILVLAGLITLWLVKVKWPADQKAKADAEAARDARHDRELAARKEENDLNRQLYKDVAIAAIATAQDNARASISEVTKEVGERVRDVRDEVTASHDTSRQIHRMIAAVAGKLGVGAAFLIFMVGCGPSEAQVRAMKSWSARARAACKVPGDYPIERACVQLVVDAAQPDAGRAEYQRAEKACRNYGATP